MKSIVNSLRDIVPTRALRAEEALQVAERQATRLLKLSSAEGPPLPESIIADLPLIKVARVHAMTVPSAAHYSESRWWLIMINARLSPEDQRVAIARELKYVLDHPFLKYLYPRNRSMTTDERIEQTMDHFAGCLLMPRAWLRKAWRAGQRDVAQLADVFGVTRQTMRVRLLQVGLIQATDRAFAEGAQL